jgi:hypothetical protein
MKINETFKGQMLELVCYMLTSACDLPNEPKSYGPFRLIDAASRLIDILSENQCSSPELEKIQEKIEAEKFKVIEDESQASSILNDLVLYTVKLMED